MVKKGATATGRPEDWMMSDGQRQCPLITTPGTAADTGTSDSS